MCGLLVTARKGRDASLNAFEKGLGSLRHRGPDAMGMLEYRLEATHLLVGHTRLAIQDTTSKGLQPMYKHGLTLVFNGELYNFKALRQELQESGISFETQSWFRGGKGPEKFFGGLRESARFRALSLGMWLAPLESEQPE